MRIDFILTPLLLITFQVGFYVGFAESLLEEMKKNDNQKPRY